MMLAARMQHMHVAHMPHSSTMAVGMDIGVSPPDLNGGITGASPVQGPFPPISDSSSFHGTVVLALDIRCFAPSTSSKDLMQNVGSQATPNNDVHSSSNQVRNDGVQ
ncbi:hypothetical protein Nepgr_014954 [Nepenthes gracilis]|uniref:Uncharacterized protein n=1 Tax=Nepenthes gracilis TaxID=150966 RepID=A0AAD3SKH5_NEPGR|nr:hypothetical protein Nepgr_014954 [Nepenthes gracilis]